MKTNFGWKISIELIYPDELKDTRLHCPRKLQAAAGKGAHKASLALTREAGREKAMQEVQKVMLRCLLGI
jgi:hypothetical protein